MNSVIKVLINVYIYLSIKTVNKWINFQSTILLFSNSLEHIQAPDVEGY